MTARYFDEPDAGEKAKRATIFRESYNVAHPILAAKNYAFGGPR